MNRVELAPLLTVQQAADSMAISKRTLEREIASGRFPQPIKIGERSVRIRPEHIRAYLDSLERRNAS